MTRPTNSGTFASSQSSSQAQSTHASAPTVDASVSTTMGATMAMPVLSSDNCCCSCSDTTRNGNFWPPFTTGVPVSTSFSASPYPLVRVGFDDRFITMQNLSRDQTYGMLTSMMENFHKNASAFADHANPFTPFNTNSPSSSSIFPINAPPALTTKSMMSLRQQMDESNHEMVNLLTQQIGIVFNPLIQNVNQSYQALAIQIGRIADFFVALQFFHQ